MKWSICDSFHSIILNNNVKSDHEGVARPYSILRSENRVFVRNQRVSEPKPLERSEFPFLCIICPDL